MQLNEGKGQYKVASPKALAAGKNTIRVDFAYDGGGIGKGGMATLFVNDAKVASGRIERTQPIAFSADETAGVGIDDATPVSSDYKEGDNAFTGQIDKVIVQVKPVGVADANEMKQSQAAAELQRAASD